MINKYLYNVFVADFETITQHTEYFKKHNKTGLTYGYVKHILHDIDCEFNTMEGFFKGLVKIYPYSKIKVYFHNLSFDGVFILDWLGRNGYEYSEDTRKPHTFSIFRTTGSKIYQITVNYNNTKIMFLCSKMLLSSSVKALGKCVNIDKYQSESQETEEFYNVEPNEDLTKFIEDNKDYVLYCKRDVEIVRLSLVDFFDSIIKMVELYEGGCKEMKDTIESPTISQISLRLQLLAARKSGMIDSDLFMTNHEDRDIMDKFTNGGLTITNELYRTRNLKEIEGHIIDLKSAYPAVMAGPLPYGEMYKEKPEEEWVYPCVSCEEEWAIHFGCEKYQDTTCTEYNLKKQEEYKKYGYCTFVEVFYEELTPKNHSIPLLKNWDIKNPQAPNYFLDAKKYTTYLLEEEMKTLEKLYNFKGKKIINKYYFRLKPYLTDFVEKGFHFKELYKAEGKLAKSHTYKILLNSAYGIHAKRTDFKLVKPYKGHDWETKGKHMELSDIDLNRQDRHSYIPNNNLYAYDLKEWISYESYKVAHKAIANYITAKTRIKLMEGILHFGAENFVYCDTDSLFLINVSEEKIKEYCGNKLGDWELESKDFDQAIVMRSKNYQLYKEGKTVKQGTAGVKKNMFDLRELKSDMAVEIVNATLVPQRVKGGLILTPLSKILTFKSNYKFTYDKESLEEFKGKVVKHIGKLDE